MKCPHCLENFHAKFDEQLFLDNNNRQLYDKDGQWTYRWTVCPACEKAVIFLKTYRATTPHIRPGFTREVQVWPKGTARSPLPPEVPEEFSNDYSTAIHKEGHTTSCVPLRVETAWYY